MICRDCQDLLSRLWERDLPSETRREAETHLAACGACRRAYASFRNAQAALGAHAPAGPRVGETFTREVMRRIRAEASAAPAPARTRRWLPLAAAASLLAAAGIWIPRSRLPVAPAPSASSEGFSVYRAFTDVAVPYRPGDPLRSGDVVVAERGGSIPVEGRIVKVGPGGIAWIDPAGEPQPGKPQEPGRIVFALASEDRVQVIAGGGPGIAWRARPADRRHYLYQLVDLAEGRDAQAAGMAREELSRILGPAAGGAGPSDPADWRLALDRTDDRGWRDDAVVFPFERSAQALGGPVQDDHMGTVSQAVLRTLGLVGDRWLPGPVDRMLKGLPREEGS